MFTKIVYELVPPLENCLLTLVNMFTKGIFADMQDPCDPLLKRVKGENQPLGSWFIPLFILMSAPPERF